MSVLLNNNSGLTTQGTSTTRTGTKSVPYGTATGTYAGGKWRYSHNIDGTISLGLATGPYKFSCEVGEWTITLLNSGSTTVSFNNTASIAADLRVNVNITCVASNGSMTITGTYTQISDANSTAYEKSGSFTFDVFAPVPVALDLPQIAWNPRTIGGGRDGVGWYLDDTEGTLCFVDSVPLYLKMSIPGSDLVEYYFDSWVAGDYIRLKTYNAAATLDLSYNAIYNEYTYNVSDIATYGAEFVAYVVPTLAVQAFIINNNVVSSGTSYIYTLTPYNITTFSIAPTTGSIGVDLIHHFNDQDLERTLLTSGNNALLSTNSAILKGDDQQSTRFVYTLPTGSNITHSILGHTSTATWEEHVIMVDKMVNKATPSANSTYYLNCVGSTVGIH